MQDLIRIESRPAAVSVNFSELRDALEQELRRYEVVVTADTVGDAKKLATELNKTAGMIDKRRKEEVAKVSGPIKEFDDAMRELVVMCKDGRQNLLAQVKRFEDETRETCRALLDVKRQELWDELEVAPEFRRAEFDDLVHINSVTAKGKKLTAKVRNELEARVRQDRYVQDITGHRLLELENASYRAGLSAPLTRDHVEKFLFEGWETYNRELERILEAEVRRQEQAEAAMRDRLEQEARRKLETETALQQAEAEARTQKPAESPQKEPAASKQPIGSLPQKEPPAEPASPGKVRIQVVAVFTPEVDPGVSDAAVESALRNAMEKAGIKTLQSITIHRPNQEDAA